MNPFSLALPSLALAAAFLAGGPALAGPGAHGPNGEHLDAPTSQAASVGARPRVEAKSEAFELVATLSSTELSIYIDRYATNEPVLKATVEVESDGLKVVAPFHEVHGDYSLADPAMLKRLATPGQHALVFTVTAGDEADLLEGTVDIPAPASAASLSVHPGTLAGGVGAATLAAVLLFAWRRRRPAARLAPGGAR